MTRRGIRAASGSIMLCFLIQLVVTTLYSLCENSLGCRLLYAYFQYVCPTVLSCSVMSNSLQPHGLQPTRLLYPWGFSRQEYWSGLPCPPPGDLRNPGIGTGLPHCRWILYQLSYQGSPFNMYIIPQFESLLKKAIELEELAKLLSNIKKHMYYKWFLNSKYMSKQISMLCCQKCMLSIYLLTHFTNIY